MARSRSPLAYRAVHTALLGIISAGWLLTRFQGNQAAASPPDVFVGWFVILAAPLTVTFLAVRLTSGAPRWVAALLIAPMAFFATALVGISITVATGLLRL